MKKQVQFLTLFMALAFSVTSYNQVPSSAPFKADYVCVVGTQSYWVFGESGKNGLGLYRKFNGWEFIDYDLKKGVKAASGTYGELVIVNAAGEIKEWNTNNKQWLSYAGISDVKDVVISQSNRNDKYALGTVKQADGTLKSGVWKVANISTRASSWQEILSDTWAKNFIKLAEDRTGNLFFVTSSGRLMAYYKNDTEYSIIETNGKFVIDVLVGENNELYFVERGGTIYKKKSSYGTWQPVQFSATSFGIDQEGNVYGVVGSKLQGLQAGQFVTLTVENPNKLDVNGNTPVTKAVQLNNNSDLLKVIQNGSNVDLPNRNGDTPLIIATKNGNINMATTLINNGANPSLTDKQGNSPLLYAVQSKNKEIVALLGNNKADLNPGLIKAAELNDAEMFQVLINYGAKVTSNQSFNLAADRGNTEIAELTLKNGANKKEALDYAIQKSNAELIDLCLKNGAPTETAIDYAMSKNDEELVSALITKYRVSPKTILSKAVPGGKTNATSQSGTNLTIAAIALQNGANGDAYFTHAVVSKNKALAELLLVHGSNATILLDAAVENKSTEFAQLAIDNGANARSKASFLQRAVENDQLEMVQLLINSGANVNNANLLPAAIEKGNLSICAMLVENGTPVTDQKLIQSAVTKGSEPIVKLLLDNGADPNAAIQAAIDKNSTSMTLMMLDAGANATSPQLISSAAKKGNLEIVSALVQSGATPDNGVVSAINAGKTNVFNYLMENGANQTKIDYVVATVRSNRLGMFNYFMEKGAPIAYKSSAGENLLHIACANNAYEMVEILLRKGIAVNDKTNEGKSPLHIAANAGRNNVNLCTLLVDNGADVNAVDNRGKKVLKVANGKKLKDYLKSKGATK